MGLKGKLIGSIEVKCGGSPIHDILHTNTHFLPNITPRVLNHFEIHEGETIKIGSVVSWKFHQGNTYFLLPLSFKFLASIYFCWNKV